MSPSNAERQIVGMLARLLLERGFKAEPNDSSLSRSFGGGEAQIGCRARRDRGTGKVLISLSFGIRFEEVEQLLGSKGSASAPTLASSFWNLRKSQGVEEWEVGQPDTAGDLAREIESLAIPFFDRYQNLDEVAVALSKLEGEESPFLLSSHRRVAVLAAILALRKGRESALAFLDREITFMKQSSNPWDIGESKALQELHKRLATVEMQAPSPPALFAEPADVLSSRRQDAGLQPGYGLLLSTEAGLEKQAPAWDYVKEVIKGLDTGEGNSFCCLEKLCGDYVQALRGLNGFHVEWREHWLDRSKGYTHYRAAFPRAPIEHSELIKKDFVNSGEARDLLHLEDVLKVFRAFYEGSGRPTDLFWRELEL